MTHICKEDWIGVYAKCRDCGSTVSHYTCNGPLIAKRPAADSWDFWTACDNADCPNHEGEGLFQAPIDWELPLAPASGTTGTD